MPTSLELRARLEDNTLHLNSCRATLKGLRSDVDFPHNAKSQYDKCLKAQVDLQQQLNHALAAVMAAEKRLDKEALKLQIELMEFEETAIIESREKIKAQLQEALQQEQAQPTVNKLEKLLEQLRSLPSDQFATIVNQLTSGSK